MPRRYKCRKCGVEHPPPTGKHCREQRLETPPVAGENDADMMQLLRELQINMGGMMTEMAQIREERERDNVQREEEENDSESQEGAVGGSDDADQMSPQTIRRDLRLMARAARRLAAIESEDGEEDDLEGLPSIKSKGTKSGTTLVATDIVKKRIDWPHMHVKRQSGGRRRCVTFSELRLKEFVYGFVIMLRSPRSKFNTELMLDILAMMMQDAVDYSWSNALTFYEMVGSDVEQGYMKWEDNDRVKDMRIQYGRAVYPEKKEQKEQKETAKPQARQAPAGMKCCAPFQTKSCENTRDHIPFTHACGYCHRTAGTLARHAEDDCFKRMAAEPKNAKKRES